MLGKQLRIGVVGPCAAGKTTLIAYLKSCGYDVRHIAQEHSYVADMWKRLTDPDVLIFLDVSYPNTLLRRKLTWTIEEYQEQKFRLRHARKNADFYLNTDNLSPQEVKSHVLEYLTRVGLDYETSDSRKHLDT
jgi:energy-coupling factor transporter ATP-binding protein EcfA2